MLHIEEKEFVVFTGLMPIMYGFVFLEEISKKKILFIITDLMNNKQSEACRRTNEEKSQLVMRTAFNNYFDTSSTTKREIEKKETTLFPKKIYMWNLIKISCLFGKTRTWTRQNQHDQQKMDQVTLTHLLDSLGVM